MMPSPLDREHELPLGDSLRPIRTSGGVVPRNAPGCHRPLPGRRAVAVIVLSLACYFMSSTPLFWPWTIRVFTAVDGPRYAWCARSLGLVQVGWSEDQLRWHIQLSGLLFRDPATARISSAVRVVSGRYQWT
jgi:hypothetical protein